MMNHFITSVAVALVWTAAVPLSAQNDMRGHWSGSLETPGGPLAMEIDLDRTASIWTGSFSIPAQGAAGIPLDAISFTDGKGSFRFKGTPGNAVFIGTLSTDGKVLDGSFSQGSAHLPLTLTKTGDAKVETVKPSLPIAPEFVGKWEGTIQAGAGLRIVVTIANGKAGAEGLMVSLDQGNAEIPISEITQNGTKLTLHVNAVGGGYEGEINKAGTELDGTWTQLGNSLPLRLKRAGRR